MKQLLILTLALFLSIPTIHAQQVWTKKQGEYYTQIGFAYSKYDRLLQGLDDFKLLNRAVTDISIQSYTEVGLVDNFMLTAVLPLRILSTSTELSPVAPSTTDTLKAGQIIDLGQSQLAFTYGFLQDKPFRMAAKMRFDLNTTAHNAAIGLRTGDATWGFAPSLLAGYGHRYFFSSAELGLNLRTRGYSHQVFSDIQIGTTIKRKFYLIIAFNMLFSLQNGDENVTDAPVNVAHTGTYLNNRQFQSPSLRVGWDITPNWSLWLGNGGLFIGGGNQVGRSMGFFFSIAYQQKKEG